MVYCYTSAGYQCLALQVGGLAPVLGRTPISPDASNRPQPRTFHQRPMVWDRLRAVRFTPTPVSLSSGSSMCEVSSRSGCKFNPRAPHIMGGHRGPDHGFPVTGDLIHSVSKNSRRGLVGPDGMLPSQGKGLSYLSAFHSVLPESIRTCSQTNECQTW